MAAGIFALGALKLQWNGARHAAVSENIANANTPGYKSREVASFRDVFNRALQLRGGEAASAETSNETMKISVRESAEKAPEVLSGNTVNIEDELKRLAETHRDYQADAAFMKAFHRMSLISAKSPG